MNFRRKKIKNVNIELYKLKWFFLYVLSSGSSYIAAPDGSRTPVSN
jgi:hypothetical protein